ncbi:MAG: hypothetical protein NTY86_01185 [Deltaproteobacteria bacterium]|nr:hypothetical protein [Deltaproteobacteria bacterium]
MNFRDWACKHLSQYKVDVLGVQEDGLFPYGDRKIPLSHILPREPIDHRKENILEKYRAQFWYYYDPRIIKLHQFFHHLNSSQALCINLFYPLIYEKKLDFFLRFLSISPGVDLHAFFEKKSVIEKGAKNLTSFDFCVQLAAARNIFVEVKYTEYGFSKAQEDDEHRAKFHRTYLPLLLEKSRYLVDECQEEKFFLNHYQILRNLVHISDTDHVVLLFPSANSVVAKEAAHAMDTLLTEAGRNRLRIVFLEEFVSFLEDQSMGSSLDGYYQDFRTKYLPQGAVAQQGG